MDAHQWFLTIGSCLIIVGCWIIWKVSGAAAYYDEDNPKYKEWRRWHWSTAYVLFLTVIAGLALFTIIWTVSKMH